MVLTSSTDYLRVYLIATGSSFLCLVIVTLLISNYWVPIPEVAPVREWECIIPGDLSIQCTV